MRTRSLILSFALSSVFSLPLWAVDMYVLNSVGVNSSGDPEVVMTVDSSQLPSPCSSGQNSCQLFFIDAFADGTITHNTAQLQSSYRLRAIIDSPGSPIRATFTTGFIPNELYYNIQFRGRFPSPGSLVPIYANNGTRVQAFVVPPADLTAAGSLSSTNRSFTVNWTDTKNPSWTKYEVSFCLAGNPCYTVRAKDAAGNDVIKGSNPGTATALAAVVRVLPNGQPLPRGTLITDIQVKAINYARAENIALASGIPSVDGRPLMFNSTISTTDVGPRITTVNATLRPDNKTVDLSASVSCTGSGCSTSNYQYRWSGSGNTIGAITVPNNTQATTSVQVPAADTYEFFLTVTDPANNEQDENSAQVVVNAIPTTLTLTPANPDVAFLDTVQFVATVKDQFTNTIQNPSGITWGSSPSSGASISGSGLFTAGTTVNNYTITATVGSASGSTVAHVLGYKPSVTCNFSQASERTGNFTMTAVSDQDNPSGPFTYKWVTITNAGRDPAFDTDTAQNTSGTFFRAGNYVVQAQVTDPTGLTGTSNCSFSIAAVVKKVTVSPEERFVLTSRTETFNALAYDQFDQLVDNRTFTWQASGGGNIVPRSGATQTADYTGLTFGNRFQITATDGGTGVFGIAFASVGTFDVSDARAYPVPYKSNRDSATGVHFGCTGLEANIRIYTASGRLVKEFDRATGGTGPGGCQGDISWNVRNSDNQPLASGVYLYVIQSQQNKKEGKLIIIQ